MRKVLIIAYFFPPIGGSGTQRPVKFVKYLPELGWQPYVISTTDAYGGPESGKDNTLLADIPANVQVWRVPTPEPQPVNRLARWVGWRSGPAPNNPTTSSATAVAAAAPSPPSLATRVRHAALAPLYLIQQPPVDPALYWSLRIVSLARRIIQQEQIDAILTTVPPWSTLLAGRLLQQLTGRPWIADFRDPWTDNTFIYSPTPTQRRADARLERHFLDHADAVISVTDPWLARLRQKMSATARNKPFVMIPNGWDQGDFPDLPAIKAGLMQPDTFDGRIVLLHPGSAYQGEPLPLLPALDRLADDGVNLDRLHFHFVGYMHPEDRARIANSGHSHLFQLDHDRVPHDVALRLMRNAHILLLLLRKGPDASSGKIFEYMVAGRPVLAIGAKDGVAAQMVRACGIGSAVDPEDVGELVDCLYQIVSGYAGFADQYYRPKWEVIGQYERKFLTQQLANLLNHVIG